MTKQNFCECMKLIKEQYDLNQKMLKGLGVAYGSRTSEYANYNISSSVTRMVKILTKAMDDTEEWIEYYIFDCEWGKYGKVIIDDKTVLFETYDDLYNVIMREKDIENQKVNKAFMDALSQNYEDIKKESKIDFNSVRSNDE